MTNEHFHRNDLISFGIRVGDGVSEINVSLFWSIVMGPFTVVGNCGEVVSLAVNASGVKFKIEAFNWFQDYSGIGCAGAVVESLDHAIYISLVFLNHGLEEIMESEIMPIVLNSHNLYNFMILALGRWWKCTQVMIHYLFILLCTWWNFHLQIPIELNRSPVLWQLYGW